MVNKKRREGENKNYAFLARHLVDKREGHAHSDTRARTRGQGGRGPHQRVGTLGRIGTNRECVPVVGTENSPTRSKDR